LPAQSSANEREFREAVLGSMERLTRTNPEAAAATVLRHFPDDHSRVLATLEVCPVIDALAHC
jgi:hypothetical protein